MPVRSRVFQGARRALSRRHRLCAGRAGRGTGAGYERRRSTRPGAILYQDGREELRADLADPRQLAELLNRFYTYTELDIRDFELAVDEFKERVPELARGLAEKIRDAHRDNRRFIDAFGRFFALCQSSLNPNISQAAVDEMLVQHLLTERLMRRLFDNEEFTRRNAIAVEVEKVIAALVSKSFNRDEFLRSLDRFYVAIENAAHGLRDFADKQHFLNSIYERFFQGYSVKVADTHGIVYTPQPIVDFMCASVVEVLKEEFGKTLGDKDINILDPCTGTGNFIVHLLRRIPKRDLPRMYRAQMFANEVMLLPYYIAALNVEHAYYELTGEYEPFEGLCFVDTLDLAEAVQPDFIDQLSERNAERVDRQKKTPITVIIGNPPYNVGQLNENDNNKNRKYAVIEKRIRDTYAKDSKATNKNALSDAYVKFFRWAVDRLEGRDGIVCFVSNNGFVNNLAFDGMRKHLLRDFTRIYHVDLHGNVRKNPKLSGTTHNVFGIQVGVGITVAVRKASHTDRRIEYHRVPEEWRKEEKYAWLDAHQSVSCVQWRRLEPDGANIWLVADNVEQYASFTSIGGKAAKASPSADVEVIFKAYSRGVATCRDEVVYDFDQDALVSRVKQFIEDYNAEVDRFRRAPKDTNIDDFVRYERIKWSLGLKLSLQRGRYAEFDETKIHTSLYRPFCRRRLFFDRILNEAVYRMPSIFPTPQSEAENRAMFAPGLGNRKGFGCFVSNLIPALDFAFEKVQCFPFYVYDEDGTNRRENITDWALERFRDFYSDPAISKWDIFHYVYGMLHHPGYRAKYADCLKRELPRIPLAPVVRSPGFSRRSESPRLSKTRGTTDTAQGKGMGKGMKEENKPPKGGNTNTPASFDMLRTKKAGTTNETPPEGGTTNETPAKAGTTNETPAEAGTTNGGFWAFANAGRELAHWHLEYESVEPSPLEWKTVEGVPLSTRVEDKMRLSKDKTALRVNPSLTLEGIPPEAFSYRLGNRSALEWVIDQYQVKEDARSGIRSDPNRAEDTEYIVRLVGQVIRVSVETVRLVKSLPEDFGG